MFPPESVFRIDHYLGKETVQNILAMRFANTMFEPIWNANYVDHVQITMAEDIGIGGRAGYYDGIGAARDVIQNHLLQLMALIAMEEPTSFDAAQPAAREAEGARRRSCCPGGSTCTPPAGSTPQGWAGGEKVARLPRGARTSRRARRPRPSPRSGSTSTPAAGPGVPFYLRTGKRLGRRVTEVAVVVQARAAPAVHARPPPRSSTRTPWSSGSSPTRASRCGSAPRCPAPRWRSATSTWTSPTAARFTESSPEAYERLILDVLLGDPPLFPQHEEVELSWKILDPIVELLGRAREARAPTSPAPGARRRPTRCWPATAGSLEAAMSIDLTGHQRQRDRRGAAAGRRRGAAARPWAWC